MHRIFLFVFTIYLAMTAVIFLTNINVNHDWFNQWFFDKFFVFQFISIVVIGVAIEDKHSSYLSYTRVGNRRNILKKQLLRYYQLGFFCLNLVFIFIILGALLLDLLNDSKQLLYALDWYIRYLLGVILILNVILCLSWFNHNILSHYGKFLVFIGVSLELLLIKPYVNKFFSLDINLLFSWVFYDVYCKIKVQSYER